MASTFILKRKYFSEGDDKKKSSGLGKKLAVGAGALALGVGAAKTGMLGPKIQNKTNALFQKGINKFGTKGMQTSQNKTIMSKENLTGQTIGGKGALQEGSQRAANAGVKIDTNNPAASRSLSNGTGFSSTVGKGGKPLSELQYEQLMAFSTHD